MVQRGQNKALEAPKTIRITHSTDVSVVRRETKQIAQQIGFDEKTIEDLVLVANELATNIVRHAKAGMVTLKHLSESERFGIQIDAVDHGPGIKDVEQAIEDRFSTGGSLGYGLGTVNRLMDRLEIASPWQDGVGTHVNCVRWLKTGTICVPGCPLDFGVATRPHLQMNINGDGFVLVRWDQSALIGVIDGVGHGQFASKGTQSARVYIESHFDQPLEHILRGVGRACRATRGVVLALARFDWSESKLTFAGIGNIETRVIGDPSLTRFFMPRGILGGQAPMPKVTEHHWNTNNILITHSDGLRSHWRWEEFSHLMGKSANDTAQELLRVLGKENDDATVAVVKRINA